MKRVSFPVAKALKEAGYPIDDRAIKEAEIFVSHTGVETYCLLPTYIDIWLWLWREKKHFIDIIKDPNNIFMAIYGVSILEREEADDPEEAIIAAIEYLVANNLIK